MDKIITLKNISYQYHTTDTRPALNNISLSIEAGEWVAIIGHNGSGKSTLMKVLTGHLQPTSGAVYATSTPVMLGVNAALVRQISGHDNITLGCLAMGMTREQVEKKREAVIDLSGLTDDALRLPMKAYSSGMASRLQFAIATSMDPEILIIDEALNTGDAQFRDRTGARIDELRQQAGCVFLVSHSLPTIREMTNRCIWIQQGELIMDGDPTEVTKTYTGYTKRMAAKKYKSATDYLAQVKSSLNTQQIVWQ